MIVKQRDGAVNMYKSKLVLIGWVLILSVISAPLNIFAEEMNEINVLVENEKVIDDSHKEVETSIEEDIQTNEEVVSDDEIEITDQVDYNNENKNKEVYHYNPQHTPKNTYKTTRNIEVKEPVKNKQSTQSVVAKNDTKKTPAKPVKQKKASEKKTMKQLLDDYAMSFKHFAENADITTRDKNIILVFLEEHYDNRADDLTEAEYKQIIIDLYSSMKSENMETYWGENLDKETIDEINHIIDAVSEQDIAEENVDGTIEGDILPSTSSLTTDLIISSILLLIVGFGSLLIIRQRRKI